MAAIDYGPSAENKIGAIKLFGMYTKRHLLWTCHL